MQEARERHRDLLSLHPAAYHRRLQDSRFASPSTRAAVPGETTASSRTCPGTRPPGLRLREVRSIRHHRVHLGATQFHPGCRRRRKRFPRPAELCRLRLPATTALSLLLSLGHPTGLPRRCSRLFHPPPIDHPLRALLVLAHRHLLLLQSTCNHPCQSPHLVAHSPFRSLRLPLPPAQSRRPQLATCSALPTSSKGSRFEQISPLRASRLPRSGRQCRAGWTARHAED